MKLNVPVMAVCLHAGIFAHALGEQGDSIQSQRTPSEERESTPAPHLLRNHVIDSLEEWEFLPDGKMILYRFSLENFAAAIKSRRLHADVYPFLSVDLRRWKMERGKLMFSRGDKWAELVYDGPQVGYIIWEHGHTEENHLEFFKTLANYCGDPILRNARDEVIKKVEKGAHLAKPPFRFLHRATTDGFTEYEFRSDGRLLVYCDKENRAENDAGISFGEALERFTVELFTWRERRGQILVDHGGKDEVMHTSDGGQTVRSDNGVWKPVEHLEFIPRIFAFCEKPLPKSR